MDNSGMYVGLDIGTTSIKVIVAEQVKGQISVLGVGNAPSQGVDRGIIIDIDKASQAIINAINQAEEKSSIKIHDVVVGVPANLIKIDPCSGMVAISDQSREIKDEDVKKVTLSAMVQNLPPERQIIDALPEEFIVDGFDGIKDPRGMVGVRLEMHGRVITGPKTIIHNIKKAVEGAGLNVESTVVSPLAQGEYLLDDGEKDFGTILIDLGGGQSTAAVIHDRLLKYATVDKEGGAYITKDISVVLNTSLESAEKIKRDYGYADSLEASDENEFPIDVVGQSQPSQVSEKLLSEIIQARLEQIFDRLSKNLNRVSALSLPGGIVLTGGVAALPGIANLAADKFNTNVKIYIPDQMGLRHPSFSLPLSLINYRANMSDIELLVRSALDNRDENGYYQNNEETTLDEDHTLNENNQSKRNVKKHNTNKPKSQTFKKFKNYFNNFFE